MSELTENSTYDEQSRVRHRGSRVKSEANTAQIVFRTRKNQVNKDNNISFIKYKRDKRLV